MIFMAVCEYNALDFILISLQIGKVGNDQIDAKHIAIGKRHTAIQQEHIIITFKQSDILADFIQTA